MKKPRRTPDGGSAVIYSQCKGKGVNSVDHFDSGSRQDMLIVGTDASSSTLVCAMTEPIRIPTVMERVQEEVRRILGNKNEVLGIESDEYVGVSLHS
ncbi:hypothetical protein C5167_051058 [Papaver somniferum]|uniref:Uncharacterized protein n=1 Tax=Papaver somniferum TaxID=3469 RepID=A0A4Y7KTR1_PAPSO|nr:hypothetical protein C5167_051058 [Papaver somniferum]